MLLVLWPDLILAAEPVADRSARTSAQPVISIIIDDIGINNELGERALFLPGDVTYAFLPRSPFGHDLALLAHELGRRACCICRCRQSSGVSMLAP